MSDQPRRCLRVGCANVRSSPDRRGLGLCDEHNRQVGDGTIGAGMDPAVREHPVAAAQEMIAEIRRPGESIRALARRTGLSKDLLWHVTRGSFAHIRSEAWEQLQEVHAQQAFDREHPAPQEPALRTPLSDFQGLLGTGVQLALLDPPKQAFLPFPKPTTTRKKTNTHTKGTQLWLPYEY